MTLGKCWTTWELMFPGCIWPSKTNPRTPGQLRKLREFVAYITDSLQHLRSQVNPNLTWHNICMNVVRPIIELLSTTDVEVYIYCLDALGNIRRIEKRQTDKKRYKSNKPKPVVTPFEDGSYTKDNEPLPLPMNLLFLDKRARIAIYLALLEFFKSDEVRGAIPEGKSIIFSGAIELVPNDSVESRYDSWKRVAPLRINRQGVFVVEEIDCDAVCEGDLQVFQMAIWVMNNYSKKGNIMIYSKDGDIPMYALLMLRVFLKIDPDIRVFCKTERAATLISTADKKRKAEEAQENAAKRGSSASSSSSSSSSSNGRRKSEFQDRYIDVCGMIQRMSEEATDLNKRLKHHPMIRELPKSERKAKLKACRVVAAGEEWMAATLISSSSHDYLDPQDFRYGVIDCFAMRAYPWWRHYFTPLVKVSRRMRPGEELLPESTPHHHVYYVNVNNVDRYIDFCYYEKMYNVLQKKGQISTLDHDDVPNTELQQFDPDIMKKAKELRRKNEATALKKLHTRILEANKELPPERQEQLPTQRERLVAGCARLAWVLQYGGVGPVQESIVVDGTKRDPSSGLSIHGFTQDGFTWKVCNLDSEWRKCG